MKMRLTCLALPIAALAVSAAQSEGTDFEVYKNSGCGCCRGWMDHLAQDGFAPFGRDVPTGVLARIKQANAVPPNMVSCHTALIDGYVIEGHVPAADIRRLLAERPEAVGLAVPGMPWGSPGMGPETEREAYDVYLIRLDGSTELFSRYEEN